jgi:hypothetical protein
MSAVFTDNSNRWTVAGGAEAPLRMACAFRLWRGNCSPRNDAEGRHIRVIGLGAALSCLLFRSFEEGNACLATQQNTGYGHFASLACAHCATIATAII